KFILTKIAVTALGAVVCLKAQFTQTKRSPLMDKFTSDVLWRRTRMLAVALSLLVLTFTSLAQTPPPSLVDPTLDVRPFVTGLVQPTTMAFIGNNDILVLEKASGKVQRVTNGSIAGTVLDLHVNSASERGLLGIALHPNFPQTPYVYLYWSESTTGADSTDQGAVGLLGNRVDRYIWTGSSLSHDRDIARLRSYQADFGQPLRGNHNGGVLVFEENTPPGELKKLYIFIGDVGRRGWLQNILTPIVGFVPNDQFGGPEPDDTHLTGVVIRLNEDGTTPQDNPFYEYGAQVGGVVGANIQKIFSFGRRNSFGMAIDPYSGRLWLQENSDDAFDEMSLVEPGSNGGWTQIMGPVSRIAQFKEIEIARAGGLQQNRWPPTSLADTPREALQRLFNMPESRYRDPEFSWKFAVAPAGIGFMKGRNLGNQYDGDLFLGASRPTLANGYLFRMKLNASRRDFAHTDARLADRVADNNDKFDILESESLLFGRNFGVGTDIKTGPDGNLYVVSLSNGAIYQIFRR
ncbi:MAG TPA: PQQ-dependent sugar dehydrogenase, partial [Blastocatellia bacterium]|nr:PQQ-dependent sugar dehydrogenase [Blastocatellia bacterium]